MRPNNSENLDGGPGRLQRLVRPGWHTYDSTGPCLSSPPLAPVLGARPWRTAPEQAHADSGLKLDIPLFAWPVGCRLLPAVFGIPAHPGRVHVLPPGPAL